MHLTRLPSRFTASALAAALTAALAANAMAASPAVPGWPTGKVAQGGVINGGTELPLLQQRPVDSVFTYAGIGGDGDPGRIITRDSKIDQIVQQMRAMEANTGSTQMLTVVFYNINGSGGTDPLLADLRNDGPDFLLQKHIINFISIARQLEGYKDARHPVPATLLLSPDFLGELHKQCQQYYCPVSLDTAVPVAAALGQAFDYLQLDRKLIPAEFLDSGTTIKDYIRAINWMSRQFAPSVPFGWQVNVWAGDETGHGWVHKAANKDASVLQPHIDKTVALLRQLNVMGNANAAYNPHFVAFDKWERDVFDASLGGAGVANGYLYSSADLDVMLQYVKGVSAAFDNLPVMLWQIPGGHLQLASGDVDSRGNHGSTEADYFLGNPALRDDLSNVAPYITGVAMPAAATNPTYQSSAATVGDYLRCPPTQPGCWSSGHLSQAQAANVFSIL